MSTGPKAAAVHPRFALPASVQPKRVRPLILAGVMSVFWVSAASAFVTGYLRTQQIALGDLSLPLLVLGMLATLTPPFILFGIALVPQNERNRAAAPAPRRSSLRAQMLPTYELVLDSFRRFGDAVRGVNAPAQARADTVPSDDPNSLAFLDVRGVMRTGGLVVLVFVAGFVGWGAIAPLGSATLAPGIIVVESHRKTIQHLEGGIVRQVRIIEGEKVVAGQPLLELDDTQARATLGLLQGEADALAAAEARLIAERDNSDRITFPPELMARASDPKIAAAIHGEEGTFRTHRETIAKQIAILSSRGQENARTVEGLRAQQTGLDTQIALIGKETTMIEALVKKGIEAMPRLLALQRQGAELGGQRGQVVEKIAQVQVNTGETQLQIVNLRNQQLAEVLKDLRDVQTRRFDLLERVHGAEDVHKRQIIAAPVAGRVVGLAVHTQGAVIRPGETLMDIVPDQDDLEVEAHLRPEDINEVQIGLSAKVSLTSYKQRALPMVTGTVTAVSADRLVDQHSGQPYFEARLHVDPSSWKDYPDVRLIPGMPVEVAVETGSRTALEYLLAPIQAVLRRGMRER